MTSDSNSTQTTHGVIIVADTEGFGGAHRRDVDRVKVREVLQTSLQRAIRETLEVDKVLIPSDTGDGICIILPGNVQKANILQKTVPELDRLLKEHNRTAQGKIAVRIRLAINFGEVILDKPEITKHGFTGTEVNLAFRLCNSQELKDILKGQPKHQPIALVLSDMFYKTVVKQQLPTEERKFKRQAFNTKDGSKIGWVTHSATDPIQKRKPKSRDSSISGDKHSRYEIPRTAAKRTRYSAATRKNVTLDGLPHNCLYVALADIHNNTLYHSLSRDVPLIGQLEVALLFGKHAILHCTDPYRLLSVYNLVQEYRDFVGTGSIVFLLGTRIQDVRSDFLKYINSKAAQYNRSGHGDADVKSLKESPMGEDRVEAVVDLLNSSPYLLHRGYGGTQNFVNAVMADLAQTEVLACQEYQLSKLRRVNLTLRQILSLQRIVDGKLVPLIATSDELDQMISRITHQIHQQQFSRKILLGILDEVLSEKNLPDNYRKILETRINLLHVRINIGPHTFLEFHPEREKDSPYFQDYVYRHLGIIAETAPKGHLGPMLIKELKADAQWELFTHYHLRLMAEIYTRRLGDLQVEPEAVFARARIVDGFRNIKSILRNHWG